jgi:type II restriction enzyme
MKGHPTWKKRTGHESPGEVFNHLINTLSPSNWTFDYLLDWNKITTGANEYKHELHLLNSLVGSKNPSKDLDELLQKYPEVVKTFPLLMAVRANKFAIIMESTPTGFDYTHYDFKQPARTPEQRAQAIEFLQESGLLKFISQKQITSLPDYAFGVEAGLDSNGRKNRGGKMMENLVEEILEPLCKKHGFPVLKEANAAAIKAHWGIDIPVDKSSRRLDFAINTPNGLILVETNFYNGGGSKLKSTASEYARMHGKWTDAGHKFLWITDGPGWLTTKRPLEEAFRTCDYILNLAMCHEGCLEDILIS